MAWVWGETERWKTMRIRREPFGVTDEGAVERFLLRNETGVEIAILTWGGIIQSITVPDRTGASANIALGFADLASYQTAAPAPYFGALTGRYANRIAAGRFTLDGVPYHLARNNGPNALHGGERGFSNHLWAAEPIEDHDAIGVRLSRISPDGEEGYPGTLTTAVTYRLTDANALRIDYEATTDQPTIVNLTNHSYFNLAGEGNGSILDHDLTLRASQYTPVDPTSIPTGELGDVSGTPFDFRTAHRIGERIRADHPQLRNGCGYDHNFVIDGWSPDPTEPRLAALVHESTSGRTLTVHTTEPGVQFYTGNFLTGNLAGTSGALYRQSDGFCLETQHFPDSPNQPGFPTTVLRPGDTFRSTTVYTFSIA